MSNIDVMKLTSLFLIAGSVTALSLSSCSSSSSGSETEWNQSIGKFNLGLEPAISLANAKPPILHSPTYEEKWGDPKVQITSGGDYELNYTNPSQPFDRLVIQGTTSPFPKLTKAPAVRGEKILNGELVEDLVPQNFRTVIIEGQAVRWFQESTSGGADGAYYSTEGFSLKDSSGKIGYYRLVVEGGNEQDIKISRRFTSVTF